MRILISLAIPVLPAVVLLFPCRAAERAPAFAEAAAFSAKLPSSIARTGLAPSLDDRAFWTALAATKSGRNLFSKAETFLKEPIPETTDALFLDYSKTGNRVPWQELNGKRRERVTVYAFAEAMENKGRFLAPYEAAVRALLTEKTWVMPAHDPSLKNFRGEAVNIDLGSSQLGWSLAETSRLLDGKLSPALRTAIDDAVTSRIIKPFDDMVSGRRKPDSWVDRVTNNWNSVCLCGVTGAVLATPMPGTARAALVKGAVADSGGFISGFPADGVSDEGLGYWGYGVGRYAAFAEMIRLSAGVDLLAAPLIRAIASAPAREEIDAGVWPAFGDCRVDVRPDAALCAWFSRRLAIPGGARPDAVSLSDIHSLLYAPMMIVPTGKFSSDTTPPVLRDWFPDSGILVCRPAPGTKSPRLAVAIKGGHNNESHNHNDNGSYILTLDGSRIVADPGLETYTSRTFSARRYDSKVLSGFGHSVPVVDGVLQAPGAKSRAVVLDRTSSDEVETLRYDLKSGYPVKGLQTLTRDFVYRRGDQPSLTLTDTFRADRPVAFETALVTFGKVAPVDAGHWRITEDGRSALVEIRAASGAPLKSALVVIKEKIPYPRDPVRLGVSLATPAGADSLVVTITPEK